MEPVLESLRSGARLAVLRLRSLGDAVLTTPALALLKQARPDLRLAVVIEGRFRSVFEGNPDLHAILPPSLAALRAFHPDLCLNLHGGARSAMLAALSGAPCRAGFAHFRYRPIYNLRIPRAQEILGVDRKVHTAEHLASAVFHLGAPRAEIPRARLYADPPPFRRPYAVIHPAASHSTKTWPAYRFLELAAQLRDLEPIFIGGPADDLAAFSGYRTFVAAPLSQVKSLLSGAALFVGNDSGPAHMAAAFGLPTVVLFAASDPEIWGPWRTPAQVLSAPSIDAITVDEVLAAAARLGVAA